VKPAEAAKRLGVGIDRIRTYCRIAGVEKRGCTYDISEETLDRWRRHPPGTALDYSSTVAGRALKGQPIAGENYSPENDDVRLARAYRQLKLDLMAANAELVEAKRTLTNIRRFAKKVVYDCSIDYYTQNPKERAIRDALTAVLTDIGAV
jgi:hypothetical protein